MQHSPSKHSPNKECCQIDLTAAKEWGRVLELLSNPCKSVFMLIDDANLKSQMRLSCQLHDVPCQTLPHLLTLSDAKQLDSCTIIACDQPNYYYVGKLLDELSVSVNVLLLQECWIPDWCWSFKQHSFFTRQDFI